jgi:hypothetical protein
MPADDLASLTAFTATWSPSTVDAELRRWSAFLAEHGITWSPEPKDRDLVERAVQSGRGDVAELRLATLANDSLAKAGDARRLCRRIAPGAPGAPGAWYVLSPEQRKVLSAAGHRFESGAEGALRQLATIPITLGAYFAAQYACRAAGLDPNVAWVVALVVYVLTVRVVRGRWPLQRT